jgi:hypothetical protein
MKRKHIVVSVLVALPILLAGLALPFVPFNQKVEAAASWEAGRIIDDAVFYDGDSMSVSQIQAFLNAKVPTCDTNGAQSKSYNYNSSTGRVGDSRDAWVTTTRATYGIRLEAWYKKQGLSPRGSKTPFTCLKDFKQTTVNKAADGLCDGHTAGSNKSAARIIYEVARSCDVSPKILLVLLQKEQSLVTDDWPWDIQYDKAAGFFCPDNTAKPGWCDPAYAGFFRQVYGAARQFKLYRAYPTNYNHIPGVVNSIRYNPNPSCGSSNVLIRNQATAGLYNYTPYQPNAGSRAHKLSGGRFYSTSHPDCGAYGNLNFWVLFRDWFGSPIGPENYAVYASHSGSPSLQPGQSVQAYITYENRGRTTWYDNYAVTNGLAPAGTQPTRLATTNPNNRNSHFGSTWGGAQNRAAGLFDTVYKMDGSAYSSNPHVVKPGESVKFVFTLSVPAGYTAGTYKEYFTPVTEGKGVIQGSTVFIPVTVQKIYTTTFKGQSAYPTIKPGDASEGYIQYQNTGNTPWYDNYAVSKGWAPSGVQATRLGTANSNNRTSAFGSTWGGAQNRAAGTFARVYRSNGTTLAGNQHVAQPGEIVRFNFTLSAPDSYTANTYREHFAPVVEAVGYIPVTTFLDVTVPTAATAKPTDSSYMRPSSPLHPKQYTVSFRNTGNTTWNKASTTLKVVSGNAGPLADATWLDSQTPARLTENTVAPGAAGTFTFDTETPFRGGTYAVRVSPDISGSTIGLQQPDVGVRVPTPKYKATYAGMSKYPALKQGQSTEVYFLMRNTGNTPWHDSQSKESGVPPVVLATAERTNRLSRFRSAFDRSNRPVVLFDAVYESNKSTLASDQHVVWPGQVAKMSFRMTVPETTAPGTYREWFQPIAEGFDQWQMGGKGFIDVKVLAAKPRAAFVSQSGYPVLSPGQSTQVFFTFRNTGNTTWYDNHAITNGMAPPYAKPVRLATAERVNRTSAFGSTWGGAQNRATGVFQTVYQSNGSAYSSNPHKVLPGESAKFAFTVSVPSGKAHGTYREWFRPVVDGSRLWDLHERAFLNVIVQ